MKKIFNLLLCAFLVSLFTSCEEDKVTFDGNANTTVANFESQGSSLKLDPSDLTTYSTLLQVNATSLSDIDRTFVVTTTFPSTPLNLSGYFTIDTATLKIPAGSYNGYIKVSGNYDNIANGSPKLVRFTLSSIEGGVISPYHTYHDLAISKF
jgi:hypothetical protein